MRTKWEHRRRWRVNTIFAIRADADSLGIGAVTPTKRAKAQSRPGCLRDAVRLTKRATPAAEVPKRARFIRPRRIGLRCRRAISGALDATISGSRPARAPCGVIPHR